MQKDYIHTLKILYATSEFGGLWKHQNSPACIRCVRVFKMSKLDSVLYTEEGQEKVGGHVKSSCYSNALLYSDKVALI